MELDSNTIALITTALGALAGSKVWDLWMRRLELKREEQKDEDKNKNLYRDDLRERVAVLESKLEETHKEKLELLEQIKKLSESLAALKVKIDYLERENDILRKKLGMSDG